MTGYGRGEAETQGLKITVEIKSVNHRYNDILIKVPRKLNAFEERVKQQIKENVSRGRVEVYINVDEVKSDDYRVTPNLSVLDQYHAAYKEIIKRYGLKEEMTLSNLVRSADALIVDYKELEEEVVAKVLDEALAQALASLTDMREREGVKMAEDVLGRVDAMEERLGIIQVQVPRMVEAYRVKIEERVRALLQESVEIEESRLIQETAIFADKTNIAEEIVRLSCHFEQLRDIMKVGGAIGRKLDFLVQEMNREVNTIGSKSPDFDISNQVIDLKSEVEKIREQIQNIE